MDQLSATDRPPAHPPKVADAAVESAERVVFLALASELARERSVLVVDDGASALAGIAAHLDSTSLSALDDVPEGAHDFVVADLLAADEQALAGVQRLAELTTATALVRLPNRPEFAPLLEALRAGFERSLVLRQHNWVSSALLDDAMFANDDPARAIAASVRKMAAAGAGEELYNVVIGAHGELPRFRQQIALTRSPELRDALVALAGERERAEFERAQAAQLLADRERRVIELEEQLTWYDENRLAIRERVDRSSLLSGIVAFWVTFNAALDRLRGALRR